jgi:hypothetical protein
MNKSVTGNSSLLGHGHPSRISAVVQKAISVASGVMSTLCHSRKMLYVRWAWGKPLTQ